MTGGKPKNLTWNENSSRKSTGEWENSTRCVMSFWKSFSMEIFWKRQYLSQIFNQFRFRNFKQNQFCILEAFLYKTIDHSQGKERSVVRSLKGKLSKTCQALGIAVNDKSLAYNANLRAVTIVLTKISYPENIR